MSSRPPRPFGVTAIIVLLLLAAAVELSSGVADVIAIVQTGAKLEPTPSLPALRQLGLLALPLALGLARLIAATGLVRAQRWAWLLVMLITGGQLAHDLWRYLDAGDRPYAAMLLNVAVVFYLNQREVQRTFGAPVQEAP